jgi:hypothetical protein
MSTATHQASEPAAREPVGPAAPARQVAGQVENAPAATGTWLLTGVYQSSVSLASAATIRDRAALVGLQRTAGNAAVARLLDRRRATPPARTGTIQRAPALTADDYAALAEQIHKAMAGWGTDEEAIFVSLQKLEKDATAIAALKKAYQDTYKEDLEAEIRSEMSGSECDLALELLGAAGAGKTPMVGGAPAGAADIDAAAQRLHTAMAGWGTDEEAIYAALLPFNRDAAKLTTLKTTYKTKYSTELEDDIKGEMSSDELAYALYLLNAPAPRTPVATATPTAAGTEQHTGKVPGGDVSLHTGATMTIGASGPITDTFSVGYKGGQSADSGWIQFIWSEVVSTKAGKDQWVAAGGLGTSNGTMDLTTDPDNPKYKVDSEASAKGPFYEEGFVSVRTATGTTIYDRPEAFSDVINKEFDAGATKVIERDHFDQFLVRDYKTIYHTSLYVQWVYTSKTTVARTTNPGAGGKVDEMPSEFRNQMIKEYPKFEYIQ